MAIKRYISNADTTITNAFKSNLTTRGTGSNMGASDVLEVFSIYGQAASSSAELSRVLIKFPTSDISTDRTNGDIPASGSVNFYIRMYNTKHAFTTPRNMKLVVTPLAVAWEEGIGLDMESYSDETKDSVEGANWMMRSQGTAWTIPGAVARNQQDIYGLAEAQPFHTGSEDMVLDVTRQVEDWIPSNYSNNGFKISVTSSQEAYVQRSADDSVTYSNTTGSTTSFYTKKFFSRTSEYFFKRPCIEARWDSSTQDDRGNCFFSSSLASQANNLNTIYLYNVVRGQLQNIPDVGSGPIYVNMFSGTIANTLPGTSSIILPQGGGVASLGAPVTGGYVSTGIYSASFAITGSRSSLTTVYDVWSNTGDKTQTGYDEYHTGSIDIQDLVGSNVNPNAKHVTTITNLRSAYDRDENVRFRMFVREKDWNPNIYTKASAQAQNKIVDSVYYKVFRTIDNFDVITYGTGSTNHTKVSYDVSGSYFDLNMNLLEKGYSYGIKFVYYLNGKYVEQPEVFKFRVEQHEY